MYKYRVATGPVQIPTDSALSSTSRSASDSVSSLLTFSDKSTTYLLAFQLAFSQFPGSLLSAVVGWVIGWAWRVEILPGAGSWRVPWWMVGLEDGRKRRGDGERYEELRRRMIEGEGEEGEASGVTGRRGNAEGRRRPLGQQILGQFRGGI